MSKWNTQVWILISVILLTRQLSVHAQMNFPDSPAQPVPVDYGAPPPGLDGRQGTTLPGFPTLPASLPTTIAASPVVNIVTPTTGQTCICVPTGQTGSSDGSGNIVISQGVTQTSLF